VDRNISANLSDMNKQLERKQAVASEVKTTLAETPSGADKQQLQSEYDSLQKEKAILSQQISEMNGLKKDLSTASR
jgi:hypothetical protein